ncbi:proteasome subunit alpha type-3 [Protopterus annectens]|uniref:proteasome subunit alpha type-3 n=1 Tax=Protopterus annectens TaxID=7888 RepID=UPI001CFAA2A4|nr:proteasome subunit alpha type-3 [Protopterus annectens]
MWGEGAFSNAYDLSASTFSPDGRVFQVEYAMKAVENSSFMLGSYDKDDGAQLYMVDPSGVSYGYWGCAVGKARQAAKTEIEKLQMKEMTCREVVKEVAKIIYVVHDEVKDKAFELELSWVGEVTNGRHEIVPKDVREEAEKYAKDSLEEEEESDDENM